MIVSSESQELRRVSTKSRWSAASGVSSSRPVMPMIAFIGVRISWLMLARKALLARLAASAASFAAASASWLRRRSVMSVTLARTRLRPAAGIRTSRTSQGMSCPAALRCIHSNTGVPPASASRDLARAITCELRPSGCVGGLMSPGPTLSSSLAREAVEPRGVAVRVDEQAGVGVDDDDGLGGVLEEGPKPLLALAQGVLGAAALEQLLPGGEVEAGVGDGDGDEAGELAQGEQVALGEGGAADALGEDHDADALEVGGDRCGGEGAVAGPGWAGVGLGPRGSLRQASPTRPGSSTGRRAPSFWARPPRSASALSRLPSKT
jgi:hypothetical protein